MKLNRSPHRSRLTAFVERCRFTSRRVGNPEAIIKDELLRALILNDNPREY
jgi:hypothetical protein